MFTIKVQKDSVDYSGEKEFYLNVFLTFKNDQIEIITCPELVSLIETIDIESNNGVLDSEPSNGLFTISWSKDSIVFETAKYGDGCGGSLQVTIPNTPVIMQSLRDCLTIWKTEYQSLLQH